MSAGRARVPLRISGHQRNPAPLGSPSQCSERQGLVTACFPDLRAGRGCKNPAGALQPCSVFPGQMNGAWAALWGGRQVVGGQRLPVPVPYRVLGHQMPPWGRWEGDSLQLMGAGSLLPLPLPKGDQGFSSRSTVGGLESCLPDSREGRGGKPHRAQAEGAALGPWMGSQGANGGGGARPATDCHPARPGVGMNIQPMYLGESAPKELRGAVAMTSAIFTALGLVMGQVVGLRYTPPHTLSG